MVNNGILTQFTTFNIGHITFHTYGIIIGVALTVGIQLQLFLLKKYAPKLSGTNILILTVSIVLGALIGGRASFVLFNLGYYADRMCDVFMIWKGGTSILGVIPGAVGGYTIGWQIFRHFKKAKEHKPLSFFTFLDLATVGTALGQSIGRWGNYVNQELFGLPSNSPLAIYIRPERRPKGYTDFSTFHPVFLYESALDLTLAGILLYFIKKHPSRIGSGLFVGLYLMGYGIIRIGMERVRFNEQMMIGPFKPADLAAFALSLAGGILIINAIHRIKINRPHKT